MAWADIRRSARQVVHDTFAEHDARYYVQSGVGAGASISVRVHNKLFQQGDPSNDGFAQVYEEIEQMILLRADVDQLNIRKNGFVKMPDGRNYRLDVRMSARDDYTVTFSVSRE